MLMMPKKSGDIKEEWQIIGSSVRGATHFRSGLPNQDAIGYRNLSEDGLSVVIALSDGHGSAKSFRSEVGAQIAVQVSLALLTESWNNYTGQNASLSAIKRECSERLPKLISREWRLKVDEHFQTNPYTEAEMLKISEKARAEVAKENKVNLQSYGATLLAAMVTEDFILCIQLGDGDILLVDSAGRVNRAIPKDPKLIANETTSLCMADPENEFHVVFTPFAGKRPSIVMLSTDGYANSFVDESGFLKAASDILDIIRSDGVESVNGQISSWLEDASKSGSGDDITVGLLVGDLTKTEADCGIINEEQGDSTATENMDMRASPTCDKLNAQVTARPETENKAENVTEQEQPEEDDKKNPENAIDCMKSAAHDSDSLEKRKFTSEKLKENVWKYLNEYRKNNPTAKVEQMVQIVMEKSGVSTKTARELVVDTLQWKSYESLTASKENWSKA